MTRRYAKGSLVEVLYDVGIIKAGKLGKIKSFDAKIGKYNIDWGDAWEGWLTPNQIKKPGDPETYEFIEIKITPVDPKCTTYLGKLTFKNRNKGYYISFLASSPSTVCNRLMSYFKNNPMKYSCGSAPWVETKDDKSN